MDIDMKENKSKKSKGQTPESINCDGEKINYKEYKKNKKKEGAENE